MPNWCNNNITISHEDPAKLEALAEAVRKGEFCKHVIPVPQELNIVAGRVGDSTDPKQIELEAAEKSNRDKYGFATWYDYCVNEWGTKWDVDSYNGEETKVENGVLNFGFDSAWSPPIQVYEKLIDQGFSIRAYYYEGGMNFAGIWEDGDDDFYDLEGNSQAVREQIPEVLDEMFCISESMEMWEEENAEDEELYTWVKEGAKGE